MVVPKHSESEILEKVKISIETGSYIILPHARLRTKERKVLPKDIECALLNGKRTKKRDRQDALLKTWSYAFEGSTIDKRELRVIVTIDDLLKIVTVVILNEEGEDL
ncbi:DUF4258 domain-containing protein [Silvanigrella aquatica]|uniref:DUF4258 domain-containing protein n=1 Tax=Silvanigrella aquatica TaxID=1915309 RepID=A0A1L4D1N5_9BACT|nr:DUF4258 domain-containing protein [Silvanigrella aquatica]APJ04107.1 hypothetical protein AXG55_09380 [Silvanigrella aquatica]